MKTILFGACLLSISASAQRLAPAASPIELAAEPATAPPGAEITLAGELFTVGARRTVRLEIADPQRRARTVTATVDADGRFRATFDQTAAVGVYRVTATFPEGTGAATASFRILAAGAVASSGGLAAQRLVTQLSTTMARIDAALDAAPPSPARTALIERIRRELPPRPFTFGAPFSAFGNRLSRLSQEVPEAVEPLQPAYEAMGKLAEELPPLEQQLAARTDELGRNPDLCTEIDKIGELLTLASTALNAAGGLVSLLTNVLNNVAADRIYAALPPGAQNPRGKLAIDETLELGSSLLLNWKQGVAAISLPSLLMNIASNATTQMFEAYCQQFTGPVKATYTQDLINNGKVIWSYTMQLEGDLTLRYRRGAEGTIPLAGELRGSVVQYKLRENLLAIQPGIAKAVVARLARAPAGVPWVSSLGRVGARANASGFVIPVTGTIQGKTLELTLPETGTTDLSERQKGRVVYVLSSMPWTMTAELGFRTAAFIFNRGMRGKASFPITADGEVSRIQNIFDRDEPAAPTFKVTFQVQVQACNPQCP
jgi:hypothetical protein